jgi:cyclopropane-fatty-acyl-phospholipid synthase
MSSLERDLPAPPRLAPLAHAQRMPAAMHVLLALLKRLQHGALHVHLPDGTLRRFGSASVPSPAVLSIHAWRVAADTLKGGDVGFAEGYMRGDWDTPDLVHLLEVLASNQQALERAFFGRGATSWLLRLKHLLRANTRRQARRNIVAHYDLGNDFYRLWLDRSMTYSSACFDGDAARPLEQAQVAKYRRMLEALRLPPGSHILEIGCGWGGFAEVAARAGHRVTGLSLSDAQTAYARERIDQAGLADRVALRVQDYRDEKGVYDGVVSIEMFEAVGERWWPAYFAKVRDVLKPGGRACIQTITIADAKFERYRRETDFIQQYIFPGGMLASPTHFLAQARGAGLASEHVAMFGPDYARTLLQWLVAFDANTVAIRAQGFDERFLRCWRFYLAYCAAGFSTEALDVGHFTFARA